jgi:hypothetical protein
VIDDKHYARQWLNSKSAAEYIGTTVGSLRNMVMRQQLSAYKPFGYLLFKKSELDRLIEASLIRQHYEKR